ncbi:hypothetical protein [Deinococcus petrolearius]|uniref:Tetratricopeptide repeat protein n=1 Tax=Deinococcus petrolearius TaxID=1751295 RepID=A0ABW1DIL3_9DEIO
MRRTLMLSLVLTATALTPALAQGAASQQAAQALYDQGSWQAAATAGAALNTSAGFALAAEATTAGAGLSPDGQKRALFQKAQGYADQAIRLDPQNAGAYFEKARAQGRLAQFSGVFESLSLAKEVKKNLDQALKLRPTMAGAYVALGLWNATLDSGGLKGAVAAQQTGARKANVAPAFERAVALEPAVITHRLEYANALILTGNKAGAAAQLQKAVTLSATNFWEQRDLAAAQALLAKLK